MAASGSSIFSDADRYQASLQDMLDLLVRLPGDFRARLDWIELPNLRLLRAEESSPRVAYMRLPGGLVFVTFPAQERSSLIYCGSQLQFGEVIFHSRGEHVHQRTTMASSWGSIALTPASLNAFGRVIAGQDLMPPPCGQIVRPHAPHWHLLMRLHRQASRLAEKAPERIVKVPVAHGLEQELIRAAVNCLTMRAMSPLDQRRSTLFAHLEAILAENEQRLLSAKAISTLLGVSQSALRAGCSRVLGMSAVQYQRLRRLKLVRAQMTQAKSATLDSEALVKRHGFASLHRFVEEYWRVYGEMPPIPPRHVSTG